MESDTRLLTLLFSPLQVNEIYHDDSLGAQINVVLVRIIMLGPEKVKDGYLDR